MIKFHRPSSFIAPHDTSAAERTLMQKIFHKKKDDLPPAERRGIQIDADRSGRTRLLCGLIPMGHKKTLTNLTVEPSREVDCSSDHKKLGDAISKIQDHFSRIKKLNYSTDTIDLSLDKALLPVIVAAENHKKPELNLQYFNHVPSFLCAIKSKNFKEGRFLFPMPGHLIHVVSADIKKIDGKLSMLIIDPVNVANEENKLLDAYQFGMAPIFTIKHIGKFAGSILEKNEKGHIRIKSIYSCRLSQSTQLDRYLSPNALSDLIKNEVSYLFEKGVPPDTIAQTIAQSKAFKNLKLSNKNDVLKQAIFSGMGLFEGRPL